MDDGIAIAPKIESRALTGLRGVGASLVMLHHFYLQLSLHRHVPLLNGLLLKGYLGVDLFFVLSGFVIAMLYGHWFPGPGAGRRERATIFLWRRVARLWPLHIAVLLATVALLFGSGGTVSPRTFIANVAMIQAWGISREINSPAWSISTEWVAYLLFPLLAGPVLRGRFGIWLGLGLTTALLATDLALTPPVGDMRRGPLDIYYNYSLLPVLRCLAGFILGLVTWRLSHAESIRRVASAPLVGPLALVLMLALMLARAHDLLIYALLPAITLGFHFGRGPLWRALAEGPLYRIGVLSYALYLIHYTLLRYFPFGWASLRTELFAFLLATGALASLAHVLIELPGRRWLRAAGDAALTLLTRRRMTRLQPGPG